MNKKANTASRGCITTIANFIVALIIFSVLQSVVNIDFLPGFVISFIIASFFINKFTYSSKDKGAKKSIARYLILGFIIIGGVFYFKNIFLEYKKNEVIVENEVLKSEIILKNKDSIKVIAHTRNWTDNYGRKYQEKLAVKQKDYIELKGSVKKFRAKSYQSFWRELYSHMHRNNVHKLDLLYTTFNNLRAKKKLNQRDFAEMIVTCIQDIPYSLVLQNTCSIANLDQKALKDVLRKCSSCCIGNIRYGVQNPVAFLGNLKGDCDTRTLLIFTILKHFKYDVAILNSNFYRHSVLGLNIPSAGLYKKHKGKKYYLWETTSKYYKLGYLSKNVNNVSHWDIIITSK